MMLTTTMARLQHPPPTMARKPDFLPPQRNSLPPTSASLHFHFNLVVLVPLLVGTSLVKNNLSMNFVDTESWFLSTRNIFWSIVEGTESFRFCQHEIHFGQSWQEHFWSIVEGMILSIGQLHDCHWKFY